MIEAVKRLFRYKYWIMCKSNGCGHLFVVVSRFKPRDNRYAYFIDGPFYTHERVENAIRFWTTPTRQSTDEELV